MELSPQVAHQRNAQDDTPPQHAAPPGTELAADIAKLWEELLTCPEVGVDDDFFALGGNSLTGIHIIDRVTRDYGVTLSVRDFYLAQTPARVAALIEQGRAGT